MVSSLFSGFSPIWCFCMYLRATANYFQFFTDLIRNDLLTLIRMEFGRLLEYIDSSC